MRSVPKKGKSKQNNSFLFVIIGILALITVLLVLLLFLRNASESSTFKGMPNYTEIKGKYDIEGFKYEKQPHLGSPDAKVKVVEFADYKCPACAKWSAANMERFKQEYVDTGKVELFFMNFAFIDRDSILAASAGEAIYHQNNEAFWEYNQELFANQGDESKIWATPDFLLDFVKNNIEGIDYDLFEKDLKNHTYMLDVKEDYKTGGNYGVNGTPQFFVNDQLIRETSYEALAAAVDAALAAAE
ncbi:Thioredoxin [Fontibacillus panacisegetis]|uniref:Thioredoxin n=1 Tax=Fontibacillus panacisegetis TaxID=670482 RepID=A0A1G7GQ07_9BACL|nr:thioredoxin domain-containing protein [Fontibacillus panacisegetis]SDE90217.1 Thioredoxin [Fontibacillus panacisegetis]